MSLVLGVVLAAAAAGPGQTLAECSWDRPGVNPFMGSVVAAVDRYADIPTPVREQLKKRMSARQYDEIATIRRDSIEGGRHSYAELRDMHFGTGQVCRSVTRSKWSEANVERGLVYCESGHCLIVPTVCRNVSRVSRSAAPKVTGAANEAGGGGGGGASGTAQVAELPHGELQFEAPSAGERPQTFARGSEDALPSPTHASHSAGEGPRSGSGGSGSFAGWSGGGAGGGGGGGGASSGDSDDPLARPVREQAGRTFGPVPPGGRDPVPPLFDQPYGPPPPTTPVPEASTWALFGIGLLAITLLKLRRRTDA